MMCYSSCLILSLGIPVANIVMVKIALQSCSVGLPDQMSFRSVNYEILIFSYQSCMLYTAQQPDSQTIVRSI